MNKLQSFVAFGCMCFLFSFDIPDSSLQLALAGLSSVSMEIARIFPHLREQPRMTPGTICRSTVLRNHLFLLSRYQRIHCVSDHLGLERIQREESFLLVLFAQPRPDNVKNMELGTSCSSGYKKKKGNKNIRLRRE